MGTDALDDIVAVLRDNGHRITAPRRAILRALLDHPGHPTADELTTAVRAGQPDVSESTVYRLLDELERLGVVDHVHLGHGPAVYHLAADDHHHLVCESCGHVQEVPLTALVALRRQLEDEFAFTPHLRHFAVAGLCRVCARRKTHH